MLNNPGHKPLYSYLLLTTSCVEVIRICICYIVQSTELSLSRGTWHMAYVWVHLSTRDIKIKLLTWWSVPTHFWICHDIMHLAHVSDFHISAPRSQIFLSPISLSLKKCMCTLHAICFGLNNYIITCIEVDFIAGFVIYAKNWSST